MKQLAMIGSGVALTLAAGYFGLSTYNANQAEQQIQDWVYDMALDDKLSWESISSSPFGGRISLHNVALELGDAEPALQVAKVTLSDVIDDELQTQLRLSLKGITTSQQALESASTISYWVGGNLGRAAREVGPNLTALKPFDTELFFNINDDEGSLQAEFAVDIPELFTGRINQRISNQRNLNRKLRDVFVEVADADNPNEILAQLLSLEKSINRAALDEFSVSIKDRGMLERSIALFQRYNTPLDPTAGDVGAQRQAHYERLVTREKKKCSREKVDTYISSACDVLEELLLGKANGIELSYEPEGPVKLQEVLIFSDFKNNKRLWRRMNAQLRTI
ncbi:hypothetical protein [Atopomonas sediminilitoris]|uniref:hypothetical protein n=1 Tax=Atopomonas sediminilitoris TaxID=2919919 RepID=UPI001F4E353D|nr:hypothetical protein [Atopomonas sediminilitoris]MCJ8169460.1 hypothetical protein [Atopomonas sediminilitoris]